MRCYLHKYENKLVVIPPFVLFGRKLNCSHVSIFHWLIFAKLPRLSTRCDVWLATKAQSKNTTLQIAIISEYQKTFIVSCDLTFLRVIKDLKANTARTVEAIIKKRRPCWQGLPNWTLCSQTWGKYNKHRHRDLSNSSATVICNSADNTFDMLKWSIIWLYHYTALTLSICQASIETHSK